MSVMTHHTYRLLLGYRFGWGMSCRTQTWTPAKTQAKTTRFDIPVTFTTQQRVHELSTALSKGSVEQRLLFSVDMK